MTQPPRIFDEGLIATRLSGIDWASDANFLLHRLAEDLRERLVLIKRDFAAPLIIGPKPEAMFAGWASLPAEAAFSTLPLAPASHDLIVSLGMMQIINDLPGFLIQIAKALKPDGLFIGALLAGDTLTELRQSLMAAEAELEGGASPRVIPFADVRALGGLLQRAGLALPVADSERLTIRYRNSLALIKDLRAMGATNPLLMQTRKLKRASFLRANDIYNERFADADGRIRATLDIVWLSGWSPHESQQKPLKPGSAQMRLAAVLKPSG